MSHSKLPPGRGDPHLEASLLGYLGTAQALQGQAEKAGAAFEAGEALLREQADTFALGVLLSQRGRAAAASAKETAARACLAEAEALAAEFGAGPDSELGRELARLREALETAGDEDSTRGR